MSDDVEAKREQAVVARRAAIRSYHHHECVASYDQGAECTCNQIWRAIASKSPFPPSVPAPKE